MNILYNPIIWLSITMITFLLLQRRNRNSILNFLKAPEADRASVNETNKININKMKEKQLQSKTAMLLVSMMFGMFGLHRYSMGYSNWWLQLLLTFCCGIGFIWSFIDSIRIAIDNMPMADGRPLSQ